MNRAGEVLGRVLARHDIGRISALARLNADWRRLVGPAVARHTAPADLRDRTLQVAVDSPVWMQQLSFLRNELLRNLGPYGVDRLTFRLGRVRPAGRAAPAPASPPRPLSPEDRRFIDRCVEELRDPDLKKTLRKTLGAALARSPRRGPAGR